MNKLQSIFLICLTTGLLLTCNETEGGGSTGALTFKIENLVDNLLVIDSDVDVTIPYTTNGENLVVTFTFYPDSTGLTLNTGAKQIIAHAAESAKGRAFRITADVTSGRRSTQTVFSIYINDGSNIDGGITNITMTNQNPYEIDASKQWDLSYTITPAAFQYAATVTYAVTTPPGNNDLDFFTSNYPNTVRPKSNSIDAYTDYTVRASAGYNGKTVTAEIAVRNMRVYSDYKDYDAPRNGQTLQEIRSTYNDTSIQGTAWHVPPVEDIATYSQSYLDDYMLGVDVGSLIEVEKGGGKFYDTDRYEVTDVFGLLKQYGINWIRLRLWHHPYKITGENTGTEGAIGSKFGGGTNDLETVIQLAERAKEWGMKTKLNLHYSDFWAHPGQQARPRPGAHCECNCNWPEGQSTTAQVAPIFKNYTKYVLNKMQARGVLPDIVQLGNENNTGIAGFNANSDMNAIFTAGIEAVREACVLYNDCNCNVNKTGPYPGKHMRIMLHATSGMSIIETFFQARANLDYDIIGISFYPMWHGTRTTYQQGLAKLATSFPTKEICLAEYSSAYTVLEHARLEDLSSSNSDQRTFTSPSPGERTVSGQANLIRNMNSDVMKYCGTMPDGRRRGIGSFWWEPAWLPVVESSWAANPSREWYRWQAQAPGGSSKDANQPVDAVPRTTWANQGYFTYEGTVIPSANAFLQLMGKSPRLYE